MADCLFVPQDNMGFFSQLLMRKTVKLYEILTHTAVNVRQLRQWCGVYCLV